MEVGKIILICIIAFFVLMFSLISLAFFITFKDIEKQKRVQKSIDDKIFEARQKRRCCCEYCGRENSRKSHNCAFCGAPLKEMAINEECLENGKQEDDN